MSEIEVVADEIADAHDAAPGAAPVTRKLGWAFWLCIGWLVTVIHHPPAKTTIRAIKSPVAL